MNSLTILDIIEYMNNPEAYPNIKYYDEAFYIKPKKKGVYKEYLEKLKAEDKMPDLSNVNWR